MSRLFLVLLLAARPLAGAEFEFTPAAPGAAFGGGAYPVSVLLQSRSARSVIVQLRHQLLQASSATVAPVGPEVVRKDLAIPPGQTVQETIPVSLPRVRGPTRFLVRFSDGQSILGASDVWAYPSNQLAELKSLLEGQPLLLAGMSEHWAALLSANDVPYVIGWDSPGPRSSFRLAVMGPTVSSHGRDPGLTGVLELVRAGVGVIWINPADWPEAGVVPSYATLMAGGGTVVMAQPGAVTNLATDPWAQLRLLRMARLATGREHPVLEMHKN